MRSRLSYVQSPIECRTLCSVQKPEYLLSEQQSSDTPKRKAGRPPGSKSRPKWLLKELKRQKKSRKGIKGRPKGSKNKPKTLEEYLSVGLLVDEKPPPKKPKGPLPILRQRMTPEERQASSQKALAARIAKGITNPRPLGSHMGWKHKDFYRAQNEAREEAKRIFRMLEDAGRVPEDEMAKEALQGALQLYREPGTKDFKLKAIRTILEYTKSKPASKSDVTVRTAEDFLDALASQAGDGSSE